jgi:thiosulfate dehydrogenase [quinone] large subunit
MENAINSAAFKKQATSIRQRIPSDIPLFQALFGNANRAWIWLIVRMYVGWQWLDAGWAKVNNSAWVGANSGAALTGFVKGALAKTTGEHPDV